MTQRLLFVIWNTVRSTVNQNTWFHRKMYGALFSFLLERVMLQRKKKHSVNITNKWIDDVLTPSFWWGAKLMSTKPIYSTTTLFYKFFENFILCNLIIFILYSSLQFILDPLPIFQHHLWLSIPLTLILEIWTVMNFLHEPLTCTKKLHCWGLSPNGVGYLFTLKRCVLA